jgi:hypothetical protein
MSQPPTPGATFLDPACHFWFQPPVDWSPMQPADLQTIVQASGINYLTGYRMNGAVTPYLLVRALPSPPGDPASSMASLRKIAPDATFDANRQCAIWHITVRLPDGREMQCVSYAFVGKLNVICVYCYQLTSDSGRYLPVFEAIANSFRFMPGYDFASRGFDQSFWGHVLVGASNGAVIGGLAGGLLGLFVHLFYRKRRRIL